MHRAASGASANGKAEPPLSHAASGRDFWRKSAPKSLRRQALPADEALTVYWRKRSPRRSVADLCGATDTPLRWAAWPCGEATERVVLLSGDVGTPAGARAAAKGKRRREACSALTEWLEAARRAPASYELALGCLAAAHALDALGAAVSPALAWKLLDFLAETARHASTWIVGAEAEPEHVVAMQMLAGELPLALGYLFGEMSPLRSALRPAAALVGDSLVELLNGEGVPRAAHLPALRPLAACWTRCRAMIGELAGVRLTKRAGRQYRQLVRQTLRWTGPNGAPLLAGDGAGAAPTDFWRAALEHGGTAADATAARALLAKPATRGLKIAPKAAATSYECEWSGLAVMRSGWRSEDAVVAIDYSSPALRLEAWAGGRRLLAGRVTAESHIDGKLVAPAGKWDQLCWFSDKDIDYLELSLPLEGGARLERQIMLARRGAFLLVVDHLQSERSAAVEHALSLPLGAGLLFCGEGETRDALVVDGEPLARLLPLALPEWRIDPRVGELSYGGGAVRLAERAAGRSLACPLLIDLCGRRAGAQATWRQLTVAEGLEIQPTDVAVSYRAQMGDDQWVYYRSQGRAGNRTFLGQNTSSECVVARFKAPSGEIEELLEIEG